MFSCKKSFMETCENAHAFIPYVNTYKRIFVCKYSICIN